MIRIKDDIIIKSNLELFKVDRGKRKIVHAAHNIFLDTGRQFLAENITASSFGGGGSFVRTQNTVVKWIGFGVGGNRQNSPTAGAAPISTDYPGSDSYTDSDVTLPGLERPVQVTSGIWMKVVSTPGNFPDNKSVTYVATFGQTDLNFGSYTVVPISEIALFKSSASDAFPNGVAGSYPGPGGQAIAYDNFFPLEKTGQWSIEARWTLRW